MKVLISTLTKEGRWPWPAEFVHVRSCDVTQTSLHLVLKDIWYDLPVDVASPVLVHVEEESNEV